MSPSTCVEIGPAARKARKRQRRHGHMGLDQTGGSRSSVEFSDAPEELLVAVGRVVANELDLKNNRFAPLLPTTQETSATNPAVFKALATAVKSKPKLVSSKKETVLAPPQSAFTFTGSRPASATSTASPLTLSLFPAPPAATVILDVPPPLANKTGSGKLQLDNTASESKKSMIGVPSTSSAATLTQAQLPLLINVGIPTPSPCSPTSLASGAKLGHTRSLVMLQIPSTSISSGWPEPTPIISVPATQDGRSRFFPTPSHRHTEEGKSDATPVSQGAFSASEVSDWQSPRSHYITTHADLNLKTDQAAKVSSEGMGTAAQGTYVLKGRDADEGYETRSDSGSEYVSPVAYVGLSQATSPALSVSANSDNGWEGTDKDFWA